MRHIFLIALLLALPAQAADDLSQAAILQARQARITSQPQQALAIMRDLYAKKPASPEVILNLGYAMIAAGQPREAVDVLDMLTAMQPENAMAYNAKAVAFDHAGNHYAAQEIYEQALAIAPGLPLVMNNLAMSYILDDKPEKAIPLLEPLASGQSSSPVMRQNLALAYGLTGQGEKALAMNLRDLPKKDAEENLRFYAHYKKLRAEAKSDEEMARALLTLPAEDNGGEVKLLSEKQTPEPTTADDSKPAAPASPAPQKHKTSIAQPLPAALPELAPAAGEPALPRGYKPSPSVVDMPPPPIQEEKADAAGKSSFWGYKATHSYPGQ